MAVGRMETSEKVPQPPRLTAVPRLTSKKSHEVPELTSVCTHAAGRELTEAEPHLGGAV